MRSVWVVVRNIGKGAVRVIDTCGTRQRARGIIRRLRSKNPGARKHTYVAKRYRVT